MVDTNGFYKNGEMHARFMKFINRFRKRLSLSMIEHAYLNVYIAGRNCQATLF